MAPKRARKAVSTSSSYDESRFPDQEAYDRFITSLSNRKVVPERVFDIVDGSFPDIDRIINVRNWKHFCKVDPGPAVIPIVREFYAVAELQQDGKVKIRGKTVLFDKETINKHYHIPPIPVDDYNAYSSAPDLDEVIKLLCPFHTTWVDRMRNAHAHAPHFPKGTMSSTARTWFYFVCARLLPSMHHSNVSREKAILIFCILTGRAIDVGSVIHSMITYAVRTQGVSLLFPSLITALCRKARVRWDPSEEILQPDRPLTTRIIMNLKDPVSRSTSTSRAGVSEPLPLPPIPSLTVDNRLSAIESGLHEHRQEFQQFRSQFYEHHQWASSQAAYQVECNQSLHHMLQQCAISMGVCTDQPIPWPTQPTPPHFSVHTPEADEHEDE